ncbi:hypothetical protein OG239_42505 (plasmid) [Streptomyces sp. NBC_00868]|uniref:hypothetical protein n=1 Tax=Streptomyces sp. NBC_00868 TaxID=2903683 RepID=UPI002F90DD4C|nr:hypothetical protein OG239_42505 [Streptomyces sp. NBC_00868]
MFKKQKWTVAALTAVLAWSVVMTLLGQVAALATLVPSLGLLIQQIVQALAGAESTRAAVPVTVGQEQDKEAPR